MDTSPRSRLLLPLVALALLLWCTGPAHAATGASPINETNLTVLRVNGSATGSYTEDGSAARPYKTIRAGLSRAISLKNSGTGVKLLIAPGTYREGTAGQNNFLGTYYVSANHYAPLVIEGEGWISSSGNTNGVILSAAENWSAAAHGAWTRHESANGVVTWTKPWPHRFGVPTARATWASEVTDAILRREALSVNGVKYFQVNPPGYTNINVAKPGGSSKDPAVMEGSRVMATEGSFWVTDATDDGPGLITVKPPVADPTFDLNAAASVEVTTKRDFLHFKRNEAATTDPAVMVRNIVLRNLVFHQGGGSYGVLISQADNFLIEDCRFTQAKSGSLTFAAPDANAHPGENRNITLRRVEISEVGQQGMHLRATNALLEYCRFNDNSRHTEIADYLGDNESGIKLMFCTDVRFYRCEANRNGGMGFWIDVDNVEIDLVECVADSNASAGLWFEANKGSENSYGDAGNGRPGSGGVANLGSRLTGRAVRTILSNNRPRPGTESYRTGKGRGLYLAEGEADLLDSSIAYGNDIQVGTYDGNRRGESRNHQFKNSLLAATAGQRLYAVSSSYDSAAALTITNVPGVTSIRGAWFGLYDDLNGTTNDNTYYFATTTPFPNRADRQGTNTAPAPSRTLAQWRTDHLNNTNDTNTADEAVDSRSRVFTTAYDGRPLVVATVETPSLSETAGSTKVFTIHRVAPLGYADPLTVSYTFRASTADAASGSDFAALSGSITIPAGQRSVDLYIDPVEDTLGEGDETIALVLLDNDAAVTTGPDYVTAGSATYTATLTDTSVTLANLTATPVSATQIDLAWTNPFGLSGVVVIERAEGSQGSATFTELVRLPAGTLAYRDETEPRPLRYRVRTLDQPADSWSPLATVTTRQAYINISATTADQLTGANFTTSGVLGNIYDGYVARYDNVHFPRGATAFTALLAQGQQNVTRSIEVRLGSATGTPVATLAIAYSGGWSTYQNQSASISASVATGIHTVFLTFKGGPGVCNLNRFVFTAASPAVVPAAPASLTATPADGAVVLAWSASAAATQYHLDKLHPTDGPVRLATLSAASTGYTDTGLTAGASHSYRLRASAPGGASSFVSVSGAAATPRESWRIEHFGGPANSGPAADLADPDADGLSNLLEYALNLDPLASAPSDTLPTAALDSQGRLTIAFFRARAELTYTVQGSADLASWTDLALNPGSVGQTVTFTDPVSLDSSHRRFLRLRVTP